MTDEQKKNEIILNQAHKIKQLERDIIVLKRQVSGFKSIIKKNLIRIPIMGEIGK